MGRLEEMYRRSLEEPEAFWGAAAAAIEWDEPWQRVIDDSRAPLYRWVACGLGARPRRPLEEPEALGGAAAPAIEWAEPWQRVIDDSRAPLYRWFAGGRM